MDGNDEKIHRQGKIDVRRGWKSNSVRRSAPESWDYSHIPGIKLGLHIP